MTRKYRKGLIIVFIVLMLIMSPMLASSISGVTELTNLAGLIDNGREVEGKVVSYTRYKMYGDTNRFIYVVFRLDYEYEENDVVYKDYNTWQIREDHKEQVEERERWCKSQVNKPVKLLIANNGYCKVAADLQSDYKAQRDFVFIRGGIFLAIEVSLLIGLLVLIFKKPKNKNKTLSL